MYQISAPLLVEDLGSFDVLLRERNLTPIGRIIA